MALPNELVDEILTRVPVKHVLRCRCVSKGWCSIIDSNMFVKKYLEVSVERNRCGVIIQGLDVDVDDSGRKYLIGDLEALEEGRAVSDISEEVRGVCKGAMVIGSVRGLVCLSMAEDGMKSVFLLNPCTRKCKKLPVVGSKVLGENGLSMYFLSGFGYDEGSDDYKVVLMATCNLPKNGIMAIVYSLKRKSWRLVPGVFYTQNLGFIDVWGTFAYGVLRWKAINVVSLETVLVGFDLGLEQFTVPQCCYGDVALVDISIEAAKAREMWVNPVFKSFRSPKLLMYLKSHEKILLEVGNKRFVWYNFRSKAFVNVTITGIPDLFFSHRYIESLFPLIEDKQPTYEEEEQQPAYQGEEEQQPTCKEEEDQQPTYEEKEKKQA